MTKKRYCVRALKYGPNDAPGDPSVFLGSGSGLTPAGVARKVALWLDRADRIEVDLEGTS